jgi:hypothetical protein
LCRSSGLERRATFAQVRRAGAIHSLDGGDAPGDQRRVFQHADAQRQVVTFAEQVHRPVTQIHFHRDLAIALQKQRQQTTQMRHGKRQRRTDANRPARLGGLAGDALLHLLDFAQQAQRRFVVALTQWRDVQAPGRTVQQAHTEALFELHQAPADELLGQPQLIGSSREAAGVHDLAKNTHVFERVHCHSLVDS